MLTTTRYYRYISPAYPILSHNTANLSARIEKCPPPLKEAFYGSLQAAVQSFPSQNLSTANQAGSKAAQLIQASLFESSTSRPFSSNLVYLQIILFLAIEAGNLAGAGPRGPSQSVLLGIAAGLAREMKLHLTKPVDKSESDPDSDESIGRRIWWGLVIMDRWQSASTSSPLLIPDSSIVVDSEDKDLLGESVYQLARKSLAYFQDASNLT